MLVSVFYTKNSWSFWPLEETGADFWAKSAPQKSRRGSIFLFVSSGKEDIYQRYGSSAYQSRKFTVYALCFINNHKITFPKEKFQYVMLLFQDFAANQRLCFVCIRINYNSRKFKLTPPRK